MAITFEHISRNTCKICGINRFDIEVAHNVIKFRTAKVHCLINSRNRNSSIEIINNYHQGVYNHFLENVGCHKECFNNNSEKRSIEILSKDKKKSLEFSKNIINKLNNHKKTTISRINNIKEVFDNNIFEIFIIILLTISIIYNNLEFIKIIIYEYDRTNYFTVISIVLKIVYNIYKYLKIIKKIIIFIVKTIVICKRVVKLIKIYKI